MRPLLRSRRLAVEPRKAKKDEPVRLIASTSLLAETLGLPPRYIRRLVDEGRIPAYRPSGRRLIFDLDEVIAAIKAMPRAERPMAGATPYASRPRPPKPKTPLPRKRTR